MFQAMSVHVNILCFHYKHAIQYTQFVYTYSWTIYKENTIIISQLQLRVVPRNSCLLSL